MPGHRHLLPEFLQQPLAVGLSLSLLPPAAACWSSRGVMTASTLHCQCTSFRVNAQVPTVGPTLGSDSHRLSLSTSLRALQARPLRSRLSARPLTAPSAWNVLRALASSKVPSLPPKILLSNYLEQWWANCTTWVLSLVLSSATVFPPLKSI